VPSRSVALANRRGLHARASAKFVTLASELTATVEVEKDGNKVVGTSIMGLMMLGAATRRSWLWWRWSRVASAKIDAAGRHVVRQ
jgi:phosphotransferase system HPr (HPr) family protein